MCNIWQMPHQHEMTVPEFAALLDRDPIFDSIDQLTVAGGESSLRTDLVELVTYLVNRMPKVRVLSMVSNGFLPDRILAQTEAILRLLQSRGITPEHVRLAGWDRHDARPGAGHPECIRETLETLDGLQELQKRFDFWLGSGFVVMHQNLHEAQQFRRIGPRLANLPYGFQLVGFHDTYVGDLDRQNEVDFRPKDRRRVGADRNGRRASRCATSTRCTGTIWCGCTGTARRAPRPAPSTWKVWRWTPTAMSTIASRFARSAMCFRRKRSVGQIYYDPENLRFRAEEMRKGMCLTCNSECGTETAIKKDVKQYAKFLLTGA